MDDNKLLQKLSQNLLEILNDDEYCDITIEVGDDPYVKVFRAHMNILNYRSSYLRRVLSTIERRNDEPLIHIKLPNILPEIFQIILRYIYGGKLSLEEYDTLDIIKILVAASELSLQELVDYVQSFLVKNKADWMEQNFNLIYQTSFEKDSFLELQKYCTNLISNNPNKIFKSLDFSTSPEKLLISIIQNDNLQMTEIQVWENVLKWGFAQNPGFPSDPSNFSKDDFTSLKNTLHQCIPFVRFYNLTSKEFFYNVVPYKKILPKELYMDLLKTFLDPDSKPIDKPKPRKGTNNSSETSSSKYQEEVNDEKNDDYYYSKKDQKKSNDSKDEANDKKNNDYYYSKKDQKKSNDSKDEANDEKNNDYYYFKKDQKKSYDSKKDQKKSYYSQNDEKNDDYYYSKKDQKKSYDYKKFVF